MTTHQAAKAAVSRVMGAAGANALAAQRRLSPAPECCGPHSGRHCPLGGRPRALQVWLAQAGSTSATLRLQANFAFGPCRPERRTSRFSPAFCLTFLPGFSTAPFVERIMPCAPRFSTRDVPARLDNRRLVRLCRLLPRFALFRCGRWRRSPVPAHG